MLLWVGANHDRAATTLSSVGSTGTVPRLRSALRGKAPGLAVEREWWERGREVVVGLDEVGRGAWAGPLTIGAVVAPKDRRITKVRDSKLLTQSEREALFERIADWAEAWAVGHASHAECDELGMSEAQRLAAHRALAGLGVPADRVLLDGNWDFVGRGTSSLIVRGDRTSLSIAAASVLAKVTRDRLMMAEAHNYPAYDFEFNKGYPCPRHQATLQGLGPTPIHRHRWVFMDGIHWSGVRRYEPPDPQGSLFDVNES